METQFVEQHDGGYWVAGTRISLDSIVMAYKNGLGAETIATECFPSLTLEQVNGVLGYYLSHRPEIDLYLQQAELEFEALRLKNNDPAFTHKMAEARRQLFVIQP